MSDNNNPNYKFEMGQVVYLLPKQQNKLVPAIIQEEIVKRSIGGNLQVSYTVMLGPNGKQQVHPIEKIDGEVFSSIEQVKVKFMSELQDMIEKYNKNVDSLCEEAMIKAQNWYGDVAFVNQSSLDPNKIDPGHFLNEDNLAQSHSNNNGQQLQQRKHPEEIMKEKSDDILYDALLTSSEASIDLGNGRKGRLKGGMPKNHE